ncbi:MAG: serine/threonine protein kinase [Betaproteobacteria bacterium]|nr:serine/threonine protein kinase [Betaproteobacteria bacterium]
MAGLDPPIERLGKYQVTEVLGKGAMGVVYKAFDPHIRRVVAIKTIRKELVEDDSTGQMIARFKNEAQAAGRLSHPGVVSVYEYGENDALSYIAMEYVQGNPLREYFNRNTRFEESDIVSIMVQLLDALEYSHEQGVIHRDIKPANIIIMTNGKLKIADFGIARIDESNLTQIGAVMGTPGYMAPEQYSGEIVDWRADLFSAGVVLYQLLTGRKPFSGPADSVAYQVCHIDPPVPSHVEAGRGWDRYDQVMTTALAKQPDARYQLAKAFRAAILAAYAAPVSPVVSEETVITEVAPTTIRLEPTQPSQSSEASAPVKTVPPPGWDSAVLKQVEAQLARFIGPVAKVMVKRVATGTNDIATLYARLADNLSSREEKKAFLTGGAELQVTLPSPSESQSATPRSGVDQRQLAAAPVTPETVAQATRLLAAYLGPIARIVIKKAAAQATDRRQFYQILADSVSNEGDRIRFLQDVRAVS